jgi:hypothetical protein
MILVLVGVNFFDKTEKVKNKKNYDMITTILLKRYAVFNFTLTFTLTQLPLHQVFNTKVILQNTTIYQPYFYNYPYTDSILFILLVTNCDDT